MAGADSSIVILQNTKNNTYHAILEVKDGSGSTIGFIEPTDGSIKQLTYYTTQGYNVYTGKVNMENVNALPDNTLEIERQQAQAQNIILLSHIYMQATFNRDLGIIGRQSDFGDLEIRSLKNQGVDSVQVIIKHPKQNGGYLQESISLEINPGDDKIQIDIRSKLKDGESEHSIPNSENASDVLQRFYDIMINI